MKICITSASHHTIFLFSDASPMENKETPFQTTLQLDDVTYSLRHVEESWIHLLKAGMRTVFIKKENSPPNLVSYT
jgi:hypothetical protein